MCDGKLLAHERPHVLKQTHGLGYSLNIRISAHANINDVTQLIDCIPDSRLDRQSMTELVYILPTQHIKMFAQLFKTLEEQSISLGIEGFGVSSSKLEDVFLHVTKNISDRVLSCPSSSDSNFEYNRAMELSGIPTNTLQVPKDMNSSAQHHQHTLNTNCSSQTFGMENASIHVHRPKESFEDAQRVNVAVEEQLDTLTATRIPKNKSIWLRSFKALFQKRARHASRDVRALISMFILPVLFISLAMLVASSK